MVCWCQGKSQPQVMGPGVQAVAKCKREGAELLRASPSLLPCCVVLGISLPCLCFQLRVFPSQGAVWGDSQQDLQGRGLGAATPGVEPPKTCAKRCTHRAGGSWGTPRNLGSPKSALIDLSRTRSCHTRVQACVSCMAQPCRVCHSSPRAAGGDPQQLGCSGSLWEALVPRRTARRQP